MKNVSFCKNIPSYIPVRDTMEAIRDNIHPINCKTKKKEKIEYLWRDSFNSTQLLRYLFIFVFVLVENPCFSLLSNPICINK
jgi:hypothetical protein